jgi:hypothetical protein
MSGGQVSKSFEVIGATYRCRPMDPFRQQMEVGRLLTPILVPLIKLQQSWTEQGPELLSSFEAAVQALQTLSQSSSQYIVGECLSVVDRNDNGNWTPLWNTATNRSMYQDVRLPQMLMITVHVIREEFSDFLAMSGLTSSAPPTP